MKYNKSTAAKNLVPSSTIGGNPMQPAIEYIIYGRFSDPNQSYGDSYRQQTEGAIEHANRHGIKIAHRNGKPVIYFDEGVSSFNGLNWERELKKLLAEIKPDQGILIFKWDRFGRQDPTEQTYFIKSRMIDRGIPVLEWNSGELITLENWKEKRLILFVKNETSRQESEGKHSRHLRNWAGKRANAKNKPLTACSPDWIRPKYEQRQTSQGLKLVTVGFELIPEHAALVKRIFEMSLNGMGNTAITKKLNGEGVPVMSKKLAHKINKLKAEGEPVEGIDGAWHTSIVDRILRNRAVLGEYQPRNAVTSILNGKKKVTRENQGEPIKNYYPKIHGITEDIFEAVQKKRSERHSGGNRVRSGRIGNLFTSLCRCGYCGAKLNYADKRKAEGNHKANISVICSDAARGKGCRYVGYPYDEFETSFLQYVSELNLAEILNKNPMEKKLVSDIEQCRARIDAREKKIDRFLEEFSDGKSKSVNAKVYALETENEAEKINLDFLLSKHSTSKVETVKLSELQSLIAKAQDATAPDINETRMALREGIRTLVTEIKMFPYEICSLEGVEKMTWKERREATKAGYSLTEETQRVERSYDVYFMNEPMTAYRTVHSHPRYTRNSKLRSAKLLKAA